MRYSFYKETSYRGDRKVTTWTVADFSGGRRRVVEANLSKKGASALTAQLNEDMEKERSRRMSREERLAEAGFDTHEEVRGDR